MNETARASRLTEVFVTVLAIGGAGLGGSGCEVGGGTEAAEARRFFRLSMIL